MCSRRRPVPRPTRTGTTTFSLIHGPVLRSERRHSRLKRRCQAARREIVSTRSSPGATRASRSIRDLQIAPGAIHAHVSGSELYKVTLKVAPVPKGKWKSICKDCAGAIDSLVELLQGRLSKGVMERICRQNHGLFPSPEEIELSCSCPDWAGMCKHVAAVLYGIGARFDHQPELLFRLRAVNEMELIVNAGKVIPLAKQ